MPEMDGYNVGPSSPMKKKHSCGRENLAASFVNGFSGCRFTDTRMERQSLGGMNTQNFFFFLFGEKQHSILLQAVHPSPSFPRRLLVISPWWNLSRIITSLKEMIRADYSCARNLKLWPNIMLYSNKPTAWEFGIICHIRKMMKGPLLRNRPPSQAVWHATVILLTNIIYRTGRQVMFLQIAEGAHLS